MKKINGSDYSKKSFDSYKLRLIVEIDDKKGVTHRVDMYTTQTNKDLVWDDIKEMITDKVDRFRVMHTATKEQDDLATAAIDEWLNEPT